MNYYNEFDHHLAAWLREMSEQKLIPNGIVDDRSIKDVKATDLAGFTQCHFFAGIGGWSLALRLAGWPEDKPVWTGSCPCQSFSSTGKRKGFDDDRDLWPVFFNLIKECRPQCVFGEQVESAIKFGWLDRVYADMETENYAVGAHVLGAHSVGANHRRYRLYWGAVPISAAANQRYERSASVEYGCPNNRMAENSDGGGCGGRRDGDSTRSGREVQAPGLGGNGGLADNEGLERRRGNPECSNQFTAGAGSVESYNPWPNFALIYCRDGKVRRVPAESVFRRVADGVPAGVDGSGDCGISEADGFPLTTQTEGRVMLLKGYGNAIVPHCGKTFIDSFILEMKNEN
jgi:DNA (cytosine-5)-methyltransferase 1